MKSNVMVCINLYVNFYLMCPLILNFVDMTASNSFTSLQYSSLLIRINHI